MPPIDLRAPFFLLLAACSSPATEAETHPTEVRPPPPLAQDRKDAAAVPPRAAAAESVIAFGDAHARAELAPIFAGTTYDARVPHPDRLLRQPLGTFTAHHDEILAAVRAIAAAAPDRMRVAPFGRTHEGRELVQVVIGSAENLRRIDAIRADMARLADPRGLDAGALDELVARTPAIAWLGYSIHGDETSGSDASLAVVHHLAAGTSADVLAILRDVVVVVDPCQNPDGRERILSLFEQGSGYVPSLDADSMGRGRWPYGRGNHYLFDMNRDWIWGTQPETRARWKAISSWHPQLLVDAHEMGSSDTYLFYPATDPLSPHFPAYTKAWWQRYGADQAAAFDRHGWSYYTREWADSWYPGYTDSWATFQGACGILYEQARYGGAALRRPSGEIVTYRDAVARQAVSCVSNVTTLAQNKAAALREYVAAKQRYVSADSPGNDRAFVLRPGRDAGRERALLEALLEQGVEVYRADEAFRASAVEAVRDVGGDETDVPAGAYVVPARQPLAPLVLAFLAFDPRYDQASLERERKELERKGRSKAYDVTGWSPAHSADLDALWCAAPTVKTVRVVELPAPAAGLVPLADAALPVYGWIVDGMSDAAVRFAARALDQGLVLRASDEPFRAQDRDFARGSLLVRRHENGPDAADLVGRIATEAGVQAFASSTARGAGEFPDLGGQHFDLLARPRVAILSNDPVDTDGFGHAWHVIDAQLGVPSSLIDAQGFGGADLRRYNVLVVPDGGGSVLRDNLDDLKTWVRGGGTLIALGGSARAVCDEKSGLSAVRDRSDVLDDLAAYRRAVERERAAGHSTIDAALLWDGKAAAEPEAEKKDDDKDAKKDSKEPKELKGDEAKEQDRFQSTFSPQGVILRAEVNQDAWITFGCRDELPVYFEGRGVLMSKSPRATPVRFASSERLRQSGLLWPEARARIADSAWCTVERQGAGQVILFASSPVFRGWFRGPARVFANAVVYGPGLGASQPGAW